MADRKPVHRRGMLQRVEQRPKADAGETASVELLLAFTRALIRECPSGDRLKLALYAAADEVGATKKQVQAFWSAVTNEMDQSVWPKGFF